MAEATETHKKFLSVLRSSVSGVFAVAKHFHLTGWDVEVPGLRQAPTADVFEEFSDNGDMFISKDGNRLQIEIKSLSIDFTSVEDWPFREIFVSSKRSVDRQGDKVAAYVSVNKSFTHIAVVTPKSRTHWYPRITYDSVFCRMGEFVACPLEFATFRKLEQ